MQLLVDVALGVWIGSVLVVVLYWIPALGGGSATCRNRAPGVIGRSVAIFSAAIPLLAIAHLFNWLTAMAIAALPLVVLLLRQRSTAVPWMDRVFVANRRARVHGAVRVIIGSAIHAIRGRWRSGLLLVLIVGARPAVQALFNLRLPNPDDYVQLRTSHELLAGSWSGLLAPPVAVLTAMVARLAASDPMQVLRFLRPILYVSCAAAAASLVKRLTRQPELGWCVGVIAALYLETPFFDLGMTRAVLVPSSNDLLAVSALLVGLALFFDDRRPQMAPWEAWATLMIAGAGAPFVAALAFGGAVVVTTVPVRVAAPSLGAVLFIAGLAVGPLGQGALPAFGVYFVLVGAGLILAYVARSAVSGLRRYARLVTGGVHPLVVVPGIFVLANPFGMPTLYLEHDATARQTVTLAHAHKGSPWVLVGAPEQEIEIGNDGEFEDLQQFVLRYGSRVSDPGFRFDIPVRRIFVQVERRPFRDEAVERLWSPSYAANSQWAAYRLRARRESLHQAALALCESYRRTHFGVSIIYEDDDLRVYAIDRTSTTGAAP